MKAVAGDGVEVDYSAEGNLVLVGAREPVCEVFEGLRVADRGVVEAGGIDDVYGVVEMAEGYGFDLFGI